MTLLFAFSEEDVETLKHMYGEYYTVSDIARALKRSEKSISQKILHLKLKRDVRIVRFVLHFGPDVLKYGNDIQAIRNGVSQRGQDEKAVNRKLAQEAKQIAVESLQRALREGMDRNTAIKEAWAMGATQSQIGALTGLTRGGISYIVNPPPPKKYDPFRK